MTTPKDDSRVPASPRIPFVVCLIWVAFLFIEILTGANFALLASTFVVIIVLASIAAYRSGRRRQWIRDQAERLIESTRVD